MLVTSGELENYVKKKVAEIEVTDVHTHLFPAHFTELMQFGVDDLLTYHYLVAEVMRKTAISYRAFWSLEKSEQADFIWEHLFLNNIPFSEACRGVITVFNKMGFEVHNRDLNSYRKMINTMDTEEYANRVFRAAGVNCVVMTNDPFDEKEVQYWQGKNNCDRRFLASLRVDSLFSNTQNRISFLKKQGYEVEDSFSKITVEELTRFIVQWVEKIDALYIAASLPESFAFPDDSLRTRLIEEVILPVCRLKNIPFAMMIGTKRGLNPELRMAGDGVGKADIKAVENMCVKYPHNKFMVTMLSRENQHELAVAARKFRNLMIFGCWWFLNNPTLIKEITSLRFELLGSDIIPQHSDARVLEQLIYKWEHSKKIISQVLVSKYLDVLIEGWRLYEEEIDRDINNLFNKNFTNFINKKI